MASTSSRCIPAAAVVLVSADFVRLCVGAMVFNVVVLALPLSFLVLLTSDRELLGDLANSRPRAAVLWAVTVVLLASGIFAMVQYLAWASGGAAALTPRARGRGSPRRPARRPAPRSSPRSSYAGAASRTALAPPALSAKLSLLDDRWTRGGTGSSAQSSRPGFIPYGATAEGPEHHGSHSCCHHGSRWARLP